MRTTKQRSVFEPSDDVNGDTMLIIRRKSVRITPAVWQRRHLSSVLPAVHLSVYSRLDRNTVPTTWVLQSNFTLITSTTITVTSTTFPSQYLLLVCCYPSSITNRLLVKNHRSLIFWNQLPDSFRPPSLSSHLCHHHHYPSLFHSSLKTYLFNKSCPP